MKSREHVFWALMAFAVSMFIFSISFDYKHVGALTWLGLFVPIVLSILANEIANMIEFKRTEDERVRKSKSVDDQREKTDPVIKSQRSLAGTVESRCRILTYIFLGLVLVVCTYVAVPSTDNPAFLVAAYLCTVTGGTFPDFLDSTIPGTMEFHRDPGTHSAIFAGALGIGMMVIIPHDYVSLNLLFIAFVMGNMTHLVADNVESDSTLADLIKRPMKWIESPGDIRHIRENRERDWLLLQAIFSAVVLFFQFTRYQVYAWMDEIMVYDFDTGSFSFSTISLVVLGITGACYLAAVIAYIAWRDVKKQKHGTKKHDHDALRSKNLVVKPRVAVKKAAVKGGPPPAKPVPPPIPSMDRNATKPGLEPGQETAAKPVNKPVKSPAGKPARAAKPAVDADAGEPVKPAKKVAKSRSKPSGKQS